MGVPYPQSTTSVLPLGTKLHVHLLPTTEGRYFSCEIEDLHRVNVSWQMTRSSARSEGNPSNCGPLRGNSAIANLLWFWWAVSSGKRGKQREGRKGNCSAFVFIPGKRMCSENRCTNWSSCPAPFCAEAGAGPGKKRRPLSTGGGRKGPGIAQSCDTG